MLRRRSMEKARLNEDQIALIKEFEKEVIERIINMSLGEVECMISSKYMKRIGLTDDQITLLMDAQEKESRYRKILESEHCTHIEAIVKITDMEKLDLSNEELLREKIRIEWDDFIPKQYQK